MSTKELEQTRQEIRKVIDSFTYGDCLYPLRDCVHHCKELSTRDDWCDSGDESYKCLMKRLTELGVAIKVNRELPQCGGYFRGLIYEGYRMCRQDTRKAGFTGWEPLVEDKEAESEIES